MAKIEDIAARRPLDKTAGLVVSSPSRLYQWEPNVKPKEEISDVPFPTKQITKSMRSGSEFIDLTGKQIARLTIIGLADETNGRYGRWVCRCSCGLYVYRTSAALKKLQDPDMCCCRCDLVKNLKKKDFFNRHGYFENQKVK